MKLTVLCGVSDGGRPHGKDIGSIEREGLLWVGLRWEERHYSCPKHGAMQVRAEDLTRKSINPSKPVILAVSVRRLGDP